jgi:hypothetical protein
LVKRFRRVLLLATRWPAAVGWLPACGRGAHVGETDTVHLGLPPAGQLCFQFVPNPVTGRLERELLERVARRRTLDTPRPQLEVSVELDEL